MARSKKNARHIVVDSIAFLWRATGDDGYIALSIWPRTLTGPTIWATFDYHETWHPRSGGVYSSSGNQIVVTNRLVRRVILHARDQYAYDASKRGTLLRIPRVDRQINIEDAVRACKSV